MGFWRTERGIGGDAWADKLDDALAQVAAYKAEGSQMHGGDHEITLVDLADLVEFCTRGHLVVELRDGADGRLPLALLHDRGVQAYANRGQIHCQEMEGSDEARSA